jgi:hypothetical protein
MEYNSEVKRNELLGWGYSSVVEHLSSMYKTRSSSPSTKKKEKEKERGRKGGRKER